MKTSTKEAIKDFVWEVAPSFVVSALIAIPFFILSHKYLEQEKEMYKDYLGNQTDLLAKSLDQTTEAIIEAVHKD